MIIEIIFESEPKIKDKMIELLTWMNSFQCRFCGARGHEKNACATRKTLNEQAAKMGIKFAWGTMKSVFYDEHDYAIKVSGGSSGKSSVAKSRKSK